MSSPFRREVSPAVVGVVVIAVAALVVAVYWFALSGGPKVEPQPRPPEGIGAPPVTSGPPAMPPR